MRVLIATDGSECSSAAIDRFFELFKPENVTIKIVSVVEPPVTMTQPFAGSADLYPETEEAVRQFARSAAQQAENTIRERFSSALGDLSFEVLIGSPGRRVVEEAESWGADLIVAGSHGYGFWERMMLGSVSQSIAQHAPCSVLIVRGEKNSS